MGTDSAGTTEPAAISDELHRLRSTLARLRGEVELLELDGRPPGREVFGALEEAFECLHRVEAAALGGSLRVVIADDDPRLAELTAARLRRLGFEVDVAGDLASAVDFLRGEDRLIVDYGLLISAGSSVPANVIGRSGMIVISGAVSDAAREKARELGAVAYLVKPVEIAELARLLRTPVAERP
jgi:CheY-like chemotaxis protein